MKKRQINDERSEAMVGERGEEADEEEEEEEGGPETDRGREGGGSKGKKNKPAAGNAIR